MKNLLPIFIFFIPLFSIAQTTKQQDIKKLLDVLQLRSSVEKMVDVGISYYKLKYPATTEVTWREVKNSADYASYVNQATLIFDSHYTQVEIERLISLAKIAQLGKQPKLKPEVKQELYDAGLEFGKKLATLINQKIVGGK